MKALITVFVLGVLLFSSPLWAQNAGELTGTDEATDVATQAGSPECNGDCNPHVNGDLLTDNAMAAQRRAQGDSRSVKRPGQAAPGSEVDQ